MLTGCAIGVKNDAEQPIAAATAIACALVLRLIAALMATGPVTRAETCPPMSWVSPAVQAILDDGSAAARKDEPLSPRELTIYSLLAQGYGTPAIADRLGVSRRTVESYFARILAKLGLSGMEALRRRVAGGRATS